MVYRRHPKTPEFVVYIPKQLTKYKGKILEEFRLPESYTRFDASDEHYQVGGP